MFNQSIFAAQYEVEIPPEYQYQTTNIYPGSVTALGWESETNIYSQDVSEDSLYSDFGAENSARIVSIQTEPIEVKATSPTTNVPMEDEAFGTSTIPEPSAGDDTSTSSAGSEPQLPDGTETDDAEIIPEAELPSMPPPEESPATPLPEADVEPAPEPAAPLEAPNEVSSAVFKMVRGVYQFAASIFTATTAPIETIDEGMLSEEPLVEEVVMPLENGTVATSTETEADPVVSEPVATTTPTPAPTDTASETDEGACGRTLCTKHVIEMSDFSIGDGFDEQQITNIQFRMSLGARPHSENELINEVISIEYFHDDEWIEGGVITINDEISNAINGGYFLFAFPIYDQWDELANIRVRLTYESDNEHLAKIYLDSAWLEVESIDGNAFNEPATGAAVADTDAPLREDAPPGYFFDKLSNKEEFGLQEQPEFKFKLLKEEVEKGLLARIGSGIKEFFGFGDEERTLRMRVVNEEFKNIVRITESDGEYTLALPKLRQFKPGRYVLTVEVTDGEETFYIDQEFVWGVLAINVDKTIYHDGEQAFVQMGVLDESGHTICDAALDLEIRTPDGSTHLLSTADGSVRYGPECAGDTFITTPDYYALYDVSGGEGEYVMTLTATTENGVHTISDRFEVRESVPFDVTRTGPTRIYPPELYEVELRITATEDYSGTVIEYVPVSFQAYESERSAAGFKTHEVGDAKQLIFDVDMNAGETVTLRYRFKAPNISPEFYLLGPLEIGAFAEIREWQIASDAPDAAAVVQSVVGSVVDDTTYSATFSSTPAEGNVIIMAAIHRDNGVSFNLPADFTEAVYSDTANFIDVGIWYKVASTTESSSFSITKNGGGNEVGMIVLLEVAGLDTTDLFDVGSENDQTTTNSLTAYTGATAASSEFAFAIAATGWGDNDFGNPTSANWSSDSADSYVQHSWTEWATGNDGAFGVAYADVTSSDTQGATLTLTTGGTEDRNSVLAVFNLIPQIVTVGSLGNQEPNLKIGESDLHVGGAFVFSTNSGTSDITSIAITENGTVDAQNELNNVSLYYDLDSTAPYDCASESYGGSESQFGSATEFSGADGTATFNGSVTVASTTSVCAYVILDVDAAATQDDTFELEITDPTSDVVTSTGTLDPATPVLLSDTSIISLGFAPETPTLAERPAFPYMLSTSSQPSFAFMATDRDGDLLEYEFTIDNDPLFGSPATTASSFNYPNDGGWASTTFASGATTTYTMQEALTPGETYWWRVRARDPFNMNEWSQVSESRSITISSVSVPEWHQTTDEQFIRSATFSNSTTSGEGGVTLDDPAVAVSLLDAWATGNSRGAPSAGTDRLLLVAIYSEDSAQDINVGTVTYGGVTLTEIDEQQLDDAGEMNGLWLGYLDETGIVGASGTTIVPTWPDGTPNVAIQYSTAVFQNVNQAAPVRTSSGNVGTGASSITPASSISVSEGDMMTYFTLSEDDFTHTPATGYTEGTEENSQGTGIVSASAYKSITADGTEFPTAVWSAAGDRQLIIAADLQPTSALATVLSPEIEFDWVLGQDDWGEIRWNMTEPSGSVTKLSVYYSNIAACDTIIPDSALSGNAAGFAATSSPLDISSLATTTYSRICLQMAFDQGSATSTPVLNSWTVSWELSPVFEQTSYWWFANTNGLTPSDTWPSGASANELAENEAIVATDPTKTGDVLRLRMGVAASSVDATSGVFKLQYAEGSSCGPTLSWHDVAPQSSTTALWRGFNNAAVSDGATLPSALLTGSDEFETYEEENNSASLPNTISVGDQGEWDWVIENNAESGTSYCFRMTNADNTTFNAYTNYPQLVTNRSPSIVSIDTPFDNEKIASTSPWFEFTGVDPEGEELDYQIQIDDDADFSSAVIDTNSAVNLTDFLNLNTPADKSPFNDSETLRYSIPSPLTNGTTYWWRVRTIDSNGSANYGDWTTARSLTVDTSVSVSTWFQTTEEQFDTDTLVLTDATPSDTVTLATGSTTGTTTSSAIDFDDATVGNAWGEFSFSDTQPPGSIVYRIEYLNDDLWELIPDSDLTGNATGFTASPVDLIDLNTETYNQIRIQAVFTNSGGSPTLSDWTVDWGERVSVPTHLSLFDNEKSGTTTPTFTFFTTDPQDDDLEYEISWSTDSTFVTGSTTANSSTSAGFTDLTSGADTNPFASGDTISYRIQSALTDGTTYWWRVRAKDPFASDSFSFWSDPWSFTVDTNATTSTWFQTTEEQFDTDTLSGLQSYPADTVSTILAGTNTYTFGGIVNPSATHVARDFEVSVNDPTDPPLANDIDTLTTLGTPAGTPNLRTAIAGYASDAEATTLQYTAISASDDSRWQITDPGAGDNAVFWASFEINESAADISQIDILLEGFQAAATDKAWLGIWRPGALTPHWELLEATLGTSDTNYTGSITTNLSEYLDGNNRIHVIFFNEDTSDSLFIDYVEVVTTNVTSLEGTITSTPLDFDDGSGPAWGQMYWTDSEPGLSSIDYQLEYQNGAGEWELIPDSALSGNSSGFSTAPVDLRLLNTTTYNEIRAVGNLDCSGINCPTLSDWTIEWSRGFTISGTAYEYDGVSSTTAGTVAVAVDGELQIGKTGTISNGSWSIENVTFFDGDVITVFVSGAADVDEAVAITEYDGVPDISGMRLEKRHLTLGSNDSASIGNADISQYDFTDDEDLFFDVDVGGDLSMCADAACFDAGFVVLDGNTYAPAAGADLTTHDLTNNGTLTLGNNTIRVSGSWDNNATTSMGTSAVIFTATSTIESVDSSGATSAAFNTVTFGESSGTATWTLGSALDVNGNLTITRGTLGRGTQVVSIAGNLTTGANGFWSGMGTTTFDGSGISTWTDQNASLQNIGRVVVDGTSKTLLLGSNVLSLSVTIGANDTLDASIQNRTITVNRDWTNNNTFTPRSGTVIFAATTTNRIISNNTSSFFNLTFSGAGGSWSFTTPTITVSNDLTIATGTVTLPTGTTTIAGSFVNSGGTFAHNNAVVRFTSSAAETLTLNGGVFTNAFYNLVFQGSGSWTFTEANATTSHDLRIFSGTVTLPSGTLTVGGSFVNSGGTFVHNNGTVRLTSVGSETIDTNASFNNLLFTTAGSWTMVDANVTVVGDLNIVSGTLTLPSGTLSLGGSLTNDATLAHSNGTVLFNSQDGGEVVDLGSSSLYNMTFNGSSGGWTISEHATTTNNTTLTAGSFTLASGRTLSVGGTFLNSLGGASTTWTGSTLALQSGSYSINAKTDAGDSYDSLRIAPGAHISMWNSTSSAYDIDGSSSLYSRDHNGVDGELYIFGAYPRTSGSEYWSYATDFDGTNLSGNERQVNVRFADGANASFTGSTLNVTGTSSASTTIGNQGGGTYTISVTNGTTSMSFYEFDDLGASGVSLLGAPVVTSLSDGAFSPSVALGTGLTLSSTTIDANPALQIFRVDFSTTTAITATNVTQTDGAPASFWWFRNTSGNLDGEAFDDDTGDPGSVRWDDSSLTITVSGTVYDDDETTPLGGPTCGAGTPVRVVVSGGSSYDGSCSGVGGTYSIPGVVIIGDPTLTVFLNGALGGERAVTVTKTPTADITDLDLYVNRVVSRHEDTEAMTIADMALYDSSDDSNIPFTAATGSPDTLTIESDTEFHITASSTFSPGGPVTLASGGTGNAYDGSLHLDNGAIFTGAGTTSYSIGGTFSQDAGATFIPASSTILMTATTSGKAITSENSETISINELRFTGVSGAWNINGDITATGDIEVATGTVTGTGDITLAEGSLFGDGLLSLGAGTVSIERTNTLGGTQPWAFSNLTLGNGSVIGTTTSASAATTSVDGVLTISTGHFLDAGASKWDLGGTGNVFVESGTFLEDTSTVRYSGNTSANVLSTNYYDLDLNGSAGTPTYTATGLGLVVTHDLTVGGEAATIATFNTSDPALDVNGDVILRSNGTLIGSNSAAFTVAGNWENDGTFSASGGTVTFDGSGAQTVSAGASTFANAIVNTTGSLTFAENATATNAFTITAAGDFTVGIGVALAVGGTFTNSLGGADTTWTGSTLHLYSGTNYSMNAKTISDSYGSLVIGANTDVRMWNSDAASITVDSTGSLYSEDNAGVDGDLYIYGSYPKTTGTDYWSYARDFDGTSLSGSERQVDVHFATGASALYTGGGLEVLGSPAASTSISNQGSGSYGITIGGSASTSWSYYDIEDMNLSGLTFSGTPNVVTLSQGDFEVSAAGGSALTVGGTVINQNPAKTFTSNSFATSTGISAFNVTATGTTVSSWRFTNHTGTIDGEAYDVDPDGDPGFIVWDDSAQVITVSGTVYSDEGTTASLVCDGSTANIHLRVAGLTSYTGSCTPGTGLYSIPNVSYSPGDSLVVYIDGEAERATTISEDPVSSINNMDLYEDRVIARHEGIDPLSIADMAVWDSSDDADIPFTAVNAGTDTLTVPADTKLIVWAGKEFEPNGNVTLSGGGAGASHDGTLELQVNAVFDATGNESHSIGGSLISGAGASLDDETSTFTFTTTGTARTIDTNDSPFYNVIFNGSGSWTVTNTTLDAENDLTISQGTVTLPTGTTTVTGTFNNSGGSFIANGGSIVFNSAAAETIRTGGSNFGTTTFNGTGSWSYLDTNATTTGDFTVLSGTLTAPSGTLAISGNFVNEGTFTHNSGTLRLASPSSSALITAGGSDLSSVTLAGLGAFTLTDANVALLGTLRIESGSLTLATGTVSIAGSFLNTGGSFDHASGTILFNSSDAGESIDPGGSDFYAVSIAAPGGGYTITDNATTTSNFSLTSAAAFTQQSGTALTVEGVFTNLVGGSATNWSGSTLRINSATGYTINTKIAGGDRYETLAIGGDTDIRMWNSSATTTSVDPAGSLYSQDHGALNGELYIFGEYERMTGTDHWSYATDFDGTSLSGSERIATVRMADGATTTFTGGTLRIIGGSGATSTVTNQGSGTYALNMEGGTINALNYAMRNLNAEGLNLSGTTTVTSLSNGDFELAVGGGSLITLGATTLNQNASMVITGVRFATTTAITGTNVELVGSTPSAWSFTNHRGNQGGEAFDIDGGDECGSIRWDDSACLLTEQSAYRWRNDDGGESVPDSEWFDQDWTKRKRVTLSNSDATAYNDAVVKLNVSYDSDMQVDFDDLRFTDASGTTTINHFLESFDLSTDAVIWVRVPALAASSDTEIYMYYGNGLAADGSNGTSTFAAFDDFEDADISEYSGDTGLFTAGTSFAYERDRGLDADGNESQKATDGIYRTDMSVSQGETIRFFQYIDTVAGSGDETCTLFGVQDPGSGNQNYAVCLELFGVDRVSISRDVDNNDSSGTILATSTISYVTGWHEVEVAWDTDDSISVTVSRDGSVVATTSATDGTYTTGGLGFTFWFQNGGWDIYSSRPLLATEPSTAFGGELVSGGASWSSALNTAAAGVAADETARVRFLIENTGLTFPDKNYLLEFSAKGGAPSCESVAGASYALVPPQATCGTSEICMQSSSQFVSGASTTDLMGGDGTFTSGQIVEDPDNTTDAITLEANEYTELEYAITPTQNVTDSNYCFRVTDEGTDIDSYSRVAELELRFDPTVDTLTFNNGSDITLSPGATTTVYATGTVTDLNGYTDLVGATSTMYRSGVGPACTADNNNCYISSAPQCGFTDCAGNSCTVSCSADLYYHADPTDAGTYSGQNWFAYVEVSDVAGGMGIGSSGSTTELLTLRSITVDNDIDYGTLALNSDTGSYNATTTIENIGNDALDVALQGTDLTDGGSSHIPVTEQIFATSTFTYSACVYCSTLGSTTSNFEVDLEKPTTTTPAVTDVVYWGIAIPSGIAGTAHSGNNTFYAISDN